MRYGARIGYVGDRLHTIARNLVSACRNPLVVSDYLLKECKAGRMAGPYSYLPDAHLLFWCWGSPEEIWEVASDHAFIRPIGY